MSEITKELEGKDMNVQCVICGLCCGSLTDFYGHRDATQHATWRFVSNSTLIKEAIKAINKAHDFKVHFSTLRGNK